MQELSALLAGQDPTPAVPERLRLEKVLRLTDVIVHIDPEGPAVQWVQAGVQTDSPWPLITGSGTEPAVTVDEISLIFRYYTAGDTGLTAFCSGEISIARPASSRWRPCTRASRSAPGSSPGPA